MSKKSIFRQNCRKMSKKLILSQKYRRNQFLVKKVKKLIFLVKIVVKRRRSRFSIENIKKIDCWSKMSQNSIFGQMSILGRKYQKKTRFLVKKNVIKRQKNQFLVKNFQISSFGQKFREISEKSTYG